MSKNRWKNDATENGSEYNNDSKYGKEQSHEMKTVQHV